MSENLIAEINLKNIKSNFKKVNSLLDKNVLNCAVIKQNAYGHGLVEVANALYNLCDLYAVAFSSEVETLRVAGIKKEILLLTPAILENVEKLIKNKATLTVGSLKDFSVVYKKAVELKMPCKLAIKINSGMNRLGFDDGLSLNKLCKKIKGCKYLSVSVIFSHFYDTTDVLAVENQYDKFLSLATPLKNIFKNAKLSISASGGILLDKKYHLDMVRTGILAYGYYPYKTDKISVKPAMKIKAYNLTTRENLNGKALLYGNYKSTENSATLLRLGYGDGFLRLGIENSINNECMEITAVKGKTNKRFVTVMDDAEKLAKLWNTISYDVLVKCSVNATRIFKE